MSKVICIMGESGSGKTTALRTLPCDETYYIDCDGKGLSWKGWAEQYNTGKKNYIKEDNNFIVLDIMKGVSKDRPDIHYIVIDTLNSIMVANEMRRMSEKNYDKWVDNAVCVWTISTEASRLCDANGVVRDDLTVILLCHTQTESDDVTGEKFTRILTNGKKLNKICLEKYFTTVLLCKKDASGYNFHINAENSTAKAPMGAFTEKTVPNDIQLVLEALKDY